MKSYVTVLAGALLSAAWSHAQAQQYPQRPVNLIVPFPPGGATDAFARIVADRMTKVLNQQVVVINRDGAAGIVGTVVFAIGLLLSFFLPEPPREESHS